MIDYILSVMSILGMYYNYKASQAPDEHARNTYFKESFSIWLVANIGWILYYLAITFGLLSSASSLWGAIFLFGVYSIQSSYCLLKVGDKR